MPLLSFLDENLGNIYISDIKLFCLVNVFLFQFKVHRCSECVFFSFLSLKHRRALNFRLDLLIERKVTEVGVWFIIYLMQDVYKFILLFPKTTLFFGDVITMWEMSFVFKNGCMYMLHH